MTPSRRACLVATAVGATSLLGACAGAGGTARQNGRSINVIMVNNPQMTDLQRLTERHFTAETGIHVNYTVLPENDVRDKISQEFSSQAGQYDVATLSNFEVPIYADNGWLARLDDVSESRDFSQDDIFPAMTSSMAGHDGGIYAEPFYGESSFLMYRKDLFDAAGITMPARPTWQQVRDIAAQIDGAEPRLRGIALRGQPGWGQIFAPLNTVINTFGGRWFDEEWNAELTSPAFTEAVSFYVELLRQHGPSGSPQAGFLECLNAFMQGGAAMWYDATANAPLVEAENSPIAGKVGYAAAPVVETEASGWLYTWAWGVQKASSKKDDAQRFIAWASGKDYEQQAGSDLGWTHVPAGKRASTYDIPAFQESAGAWYEQELSALQSVDLDNPGTQSRPYSGVQFLAIPEFPDLGTKVSHNISAAIAGRMTTEEALDRSQNLAQRIGEKRRERIARHA